MRKIKEDNKTEYGHCTCKSMSPYRNEENIWYCDRCDKPLDPVSDEVDTDLEYEKHYESNQERVI